MTNELMEKICAHFNINKNTEVKRKFGKLPAYTYNDILSRILQYNDTRTPITVIFPEMTRPTSSAMLKKAFPNKLNTKQSWISYLLLSIGMKYCSSCRELKTLDCYSVDNNTYSKIRDCCKVCDSFANKLHRQENVEHYKIAKHEHYINNKAKYYAKKLKRANHIRQATPSWANIEKMNYIYKNAPKGYHVDHIIPINGNNVCGLHTEHNLQYMLAADNISKGNIFDIDNYIHIIPD